MEATQLLIVHQITMEVVIIITDHQVDRLMILIAQTTSNNNSSNNSQLLQKQKFYAEHASQVLIFIRENVYLEINVLLEKLLIYKTLRFPALIVH